MSDAILHERMIGELWAWVVIDELGNEGVLRRRTPIGTQPMIADSRENLEAFAPEAREAAGTIRLQLKPVRFVRSDQEDDGA